MSRSKLNISRDTSDEVLIEDLRRVATLLQKDSVTINDYNQYGKYHAAILTRRFKSWFSCLDKAGLQMSRSKFNISDEELFEELENVWTKLGKQPSYSQMRDISKFSIRTYEHRFNGWRNALNAFINYINDNVNDKENNDNVNTKELDSVNFDKQDDSNSHKTSRTINLRTRFIVFQRDNFKCCACGASPAKDPAVELQVDHVIPWSKGGETVVDNLQTLCSRCNLGKSDILSDIL